MIQASSGSALMDFTLAAIVIVYLFYWYFTKNYSYWDKRGVPNVKRGLLLDSLLGRKSQSDGMIEIYKSFPRVKYFGMFQMRKPMLVVKDPELINKILVKDFNYFQDRATPRNKNDPLGGHLFNLRGSWWRAMRYKLTPTFSTGKLKGMFEQVAKCGDHLAKRIEELTDKNTEVEAKSFLFEFTTEVISSCAFGLQFQLASPEFTRFKEAVTNIFKPNFKTMINVMIFGLYPKLVELLDLRTFIRKEQADYFSSLIKATVKFRRENNVKRNDYLQLLLTLQDQEDSGTDMTLSVGTTDEDDVVIDQMKYAGQSDWNTTHNHKLFTDLGVAANSVIFLIAGSESTSSTISHTLLELALHSEVQHRLQQEVDEVLEAHGRQWTYQTIRDMTYLDQVIQEALRLYPIVAILTRECTRQYQLSDLVLEEGSVVAIPVSALHLDPLHYPEPEAFRPERFAGNNFKPSPTYLPFGDGPRICIAVRFAVMEVKTAIARIMAGYSVTLSARTKLPVTLNPRAIVPVVEGGVWLSFQRRHTEQ